VRVLVLGGCGFIGSHVVDALLGARMTVRVFDRMPEKYRQPLGSVEYCIGDLRDKYLLYEALYDIDVVIHMMGATVPGTAALDPQSDINGNLIPSVSILEAMTKLSVRRLIYFSSGGTVYGMPEIVPTPESHPLRPVNSYGIVKVAIEHYIGAYARSAGLSAAIIRPSNPYGPRQGHVGIQGVIATFMNRILNDEPIHIWGDGSVVRDYIYVDDVAALCVAALKTGATGAFNAGSGQGISVNSVIEHLRKVTGREPKAIFQAGRSIDVPRSVLDIRAARERLDWEPKVDLETGLKRLWVWLTTEGRSHNEKPEGDMDV